MVDVIECASATANRRDLEDFFRFRHRIFTDQLGWDTPNFAQNAGMEIDDFDDGSAVYMFHRDESGQIVAGLRLLQTMKPYLLGDRFGNMVDGAVPRAPNLFEVTRLAVDPDAARKHGASTLLRLLVWGLMEYGLKRSVAGYVSLSYLAMERLLRNSGCRFRRLGAPVPIDGRASVALRFEVGQDIRDCCAAALEIGFGDALVLRMRSEPQVELFDQAA
ncbi:MAG: acyl-homoserine-lactone synthase [Pseudomonadota bacterium]